MYNNKIFASTIDNIAIKPSLTNDDPHDKTTFSTRVSDLQRNTFHQSGTRYPIGFEKDKMNDATNTRKDAAGLWDNETFLQQILYIIYSTKTMTLNTVNNTRIGSKVF